jgi:hypothetical protein
MLISPARGGYSMAAHGYAIRTIRKHSLCVALLVTFNLPLVVVVHLPLTSCRESALLAWTTIQIHLASSEERMLNPATRVATPAFLTGLLRFGA